MQRLCASFRAEPIEVCARVCGGGVPAGVAGEELAVPCLERTALAAHRRDRPSLCSNRRYSYSQQPIGAFQLSHNVCHATYTMQRGWSSVAGAGLGSEAMRCWPIMHELPFVSVPC